VDANADLVDQTQAALIRRHLIVENPFFRFGDRDRFGKQIANFQHFDAAVAHFGHEIEIITPRVVDL
jgi:hypothetical protein